MKFRACDVAEGTWLVETAGNLGKVSGGVTKINSEFNYGDLTGTVKNLPCLSTYLTNWCKRKILSIMVTGCGGGSWKMFYPADFKSRFVSDPFFLSVLNMIDIFFVVTSLKVDLIQSLNFKKKNWKIKKMSYSGYSK